MCLALNMFIWMRSTVISVFFAICALVLCNCISCRNWCGLCVPLMCKLCSGSVVYAQLLQWSRFFSMLHMQSDCILWLQCICHRSHLYSLYVCSCVSVTGHMFIVWLCTVVTVHLSQVTYLQSVLYSYSCADVTGHKFTVCTLQLQLYSCHRSQVYSLYTTVTAVRLSQVTCLQSVI